MSFFNNPFFSAPAPVIPDLSGPVGVVEPYVNVIGANGPTGPASFAKPPPPATNEDDVPDVPLTFDQETNLLVRMNEQQGKTIEELQKRVEELEKEVLAKPIPPVCYIKCPHCRDEDESV
jgi:hypothetical protein